ncbi:MAG: hybrid sensor histidine kinase/response regulator [Myxococcales bacterium]|nr:hybrid sensor histidine kinase/response regulator [Myxococcales bacterium]
MQRVRGSVLIVEDDPGLCGVMRRILSDSFDVLVVFDGLEALALFEAGQRFDVVLCDLHMPRMGGLDLLRALTVLDRQQAARVILVTGNPHGSGVENYFVVEKPFNVQRLRDLVGLVADAAQQDYFPAPRTRAPL